MKKLLKGLSCSQGLKEFLPSRRGGTEVAVTRKLIQKGRIPRDDSIVISITGNGYKTLEAVARSVEQPYTIKATLENFDQLYQHLNPPVSQAAGS
jgi:threonine synthase